MTEMGKREDNTGNTYKGGYAPKEKKRKTDHGFVPVPQIIGAFKHHDTTILGANGDNGTRHLKKIEDRRWRSGLGRTQNAQYTTRHVYDCCGHSSQSRKQSKLGPECINWTYQRKTMCTEKHKHGNLLKFKVEKLNGRSTTKTRFSTKTGGRQNPKQVIQITEIGKCEDNTANT